MRTKNFMILIVAGFSLSLFWTSTFCYAGYGGENESLVHFVWVGTPKNKKEQILAQLGPRSLVNQVRINRNPLLKAPKILMWVNDSSIDVFRILFANYPEVKLRSIDSFLKGGLSHISEKEVLALKDALIRLDKEAPSLGMAHQKDLLSIMIILELGGYFFDCTGRFSGLPDFFNQPPAKKIIFNKKVLETPFYSLTGEYKFSPWGAATDVWAFAAPAPNDSLFRTTVTNYIERLKKYILEGTKPEVSEMGGAKIISNIVPRAIDAFKAALEIIYGTHPSLDLIEKISWAPEQTEWGYKVPDLTFEKLFAGLWRRPGGFAAAKPGYWKNLGYSDNEIKEILGH